MALEDALYEKVEKESTGPPKTTSVTWMNPEHPDAVQYDFDDPNLQKEMFDAARYIQSRLRVHRMQLFGRFAIAVKELEDNDNPEPLEELVDDLTK